VMKQLAALAVARQGDAVVQLSEARLIGVLTITSFNE